MALTSYNVDYTRTTGGCSGMSGGSETEDAALAECLKYAHYLKENCPDVRIQEISVSCGECGGAGTIRIANKRQRGWSEGKQVRCPMCKGKNNKRVINLAPLALAGILLTE